MKNHGGYPEAAGESAHRPGHRMDRLAEYRDARFVDFKSLIDGGIIVQQSSLNAIRSKKDFKIATATYKGKTYTIERQPTEKEYRI